MSGITSHVLDTSRGLPAEGIEVQLELRDPNDSSNWKIIGSGPTDADGRAHGLSPEKIYAGHYRINFLVAKYFESQNVEAFYPVVRIEFQIKDASQHFHVPLLLNPFGYSTYRGS